MKLFSRCLAGLAAGLPTPKEQLAQAKAVLSQLQQRWGAEAYTHYLIRPDIQVYYKQLG